MHTTLEESRKLQRASRPVPERFKTRPLTLWLDRFMTYFIKAGGIGIIAAVLGIFVFIFSQTLPLFRGAEVREKAVYSLEPGDYQMLGADEWGQLPFVAEKNGTLNFFDVTKGKIISRFNPSETSGKEVTAYRYNFSQQEMIYGTADGFFFIVPVAYARNHKDNQNTVTVTTEPGAAVEIGSHRSPVTQIAAAHSGEAQLVAAIQEGPEGSTLTAVSMTQENSLMGEGELSVDQVYDLTPMIKGTPEKMLVNSQADGILVSTAEGKIFYIAFKSGKATLRQAWEPFKGTGNPAVASMDYLLGEVSVVLTSAEGVNQVYSLFVAGGDTERKYGLTKKFPGLKGAATFYNASLRNKTFLIGQGSTASLRHSTTEQVRWERQLPFTPVAGIIGRKYDSLFFLDDQNKLHVYKMHDDHPEASWKAFFSKIRYEGYSEPRYEWQSSGASDDFEPKLSLIPLIIGTIKGTIYAIIFAFPIALLAAIYTAQFAHPRFKIMVKPVMEIMASLPSVVLGFISALWLAPLLETRIPSLILVLVLVPAVSLGAGFFWSSLPVRYRVLIKPGHEWLVLTPLLFLTIVAGWQLGPWLERLCFVVTDPDTGLKIADFRRWWPSVTGARFEQRNSLVVGFMMGFAVIPIIFTIAEDALSNVPKTLVSGSLALGASRWQTALRVVLPTAFPGIFSAVMIGLGRAIGETMIVVMATGNTPIMDFNIFSGMRTLSANIAVELPEAAYLGTLYRTLFFGATVLFLMTFVMNTAAEIIRQRLREKYRTV